MDGGNYYPDDIQATVQATAMQAAATDHVAWAHRAARRTSPAGHHGMTETSDEAAELRRWLIDYLINIIGCSPDDIELDAPMNDLGVGSTDAVVLSGELSELLGRPVSPVEFWQHPTIDTLAQFLTAPEPEPGDARVPDCERAWRNEPIAVIGLGCRLPGGIHGPDALWQFLCDGRSAVTEVPPDRWEPFDDGSAEAAAALSRTTRWGAFLDGIDAFDAEFFEISPSEAAKMDPQQRLLLEVAYEALEHAGIPATSLRQTKTGVFAGACLGEYGYLASADLSRIDAFTGTGGALSIIANRLSYFLDLRGPSVAIDTACSSSLVAVHMACQSLRTADADLAIAAGVNLLLSPAVTRSFDEAKAMSPTGQCHAFDAGADGFVRAEGCGVAVLKRLGDALQAGDRVLAVVRGSAVNQDGRSNGLMAPNPAAQMTVLRDAYASAGVEPLQVDYIEAHGTGTLLGDPIEARALGTVLGRARPQSSPLLIGSVKSNLGHLEAAAGITGFAKAVLAVQHGHIPRNLHFEAPNPHIPFQNLRLKVVAEPTDWPSTGRPRRAGVSSFGFGGTNAHVVLEEAPALTAATAPAGPTDAVTTLVVSGKTADRVAATAGALADWMEGAGAGVALADVAHTVNHHRARHAKFATVAAYERGQAVAGLRALAAGRSIVGLVGPHDGPCRPGTVFVYSGQGSQWPGMGRRLLADEPVFAAAVADLEPLFVAETGFSLQEVIARGEPVSGIERIQPVLVGMQLALTTLWRSYGVEPDAVIGHSLGEVTAAVVAGGLTAADGLRVIATRSRLMSRLSGKGAMALLELDPDRTQALISSYPDVVLAVYASPRQSVIAGPAEHVDAVIATVAARDRLARRIDVDVASHHPIVDPVLHELRAALADVSPRSPTIPFITTCYDHTGATAPLFGAQYWCDNLRNPVRFSQAVAAAGQSHGTFVEVGPHSLLTHAITDTLAPLHHHSLATLYRDSHDTFAFHTNLNGAHTDHPPQTDHPPEPHPVLPSTPWHHSRHWFATTKGRGVSAGQRAVPRAGTLLGGRVAVSSTPPAHLWQSRLVPGAMPYPGGHRVQGVEVVPVSVLLNTVLCAAAESAASAVSAVRFEHPIVVDHRRTIQVLADAESLTVSSTSTPDGPADEWVRHVSARLSPLPAELEPRDDTGAVGGRIHEITARQTALSVAEHLGTWGVEGQPFNWSIESCRLSATGVMVADVALPAPSTVALLDAAVHLARLVGPDDGLPMVPADSGELRMGTALTTPRGSVEIRRRGGDGDEFIVDLTGKGPDGGVCFSIRSLRYAALQPGAAADGDPRRLAHAIEWQPSHAVRSRPQTPGVSGTVAVIGGDRGDRERLQEGLADAGYPRGGQGDARFVVYLAHPDPAHALENATENAAETDLDYAVRAAAGVTQLVRDLAGRRERDRVGLWIVTRGVHESACDGALRQSFLWGLAGVIAAEHPDVWGGLIDIPFGDDAGGHAAALAGVFQTAVQTTTTSVLVLRDGEFLAPVLAPLTGAPVREPPRCRPDAAYLITGGMGAVGVLMASWLADRGARRLVLVGRTALPQRHDWDRVTDPDTGRKIAAIRALESRGVSVDAVALDVGSGEAVQALLARRDRDGAPPIRGVIHAAGISDSRLLAETTDDALRQVMWPKIGGAQALHRAFPPGGLDFFVLTASAATVFGIPGQGAYAAANAYLDALARARHRHGCRTLSLDFGAWQGLGFGADAPMVIHELTRMGSRPITSEEAFAAWEHTERYDIARAVIAPLPSAAGQDLSAATGGRLVAGRAAAWSQLPARDVQDELGNRLRAIVADELGIPESELDADRPFIELGLNSIMALSIRREIEHLAGLELSATMIWNHPTVAALSAHLAKRLARQEERQEETAVKATAVAPDSTSGVLQGLFDRIRSAPSDIETRV
jgi:phthiocerol/phenolphthiocerol synthesis type-I polyketide synthase A